MGFLKNVGKWIANNALGLIGVGGSAAAAAAANKQAKLNYEAQKYSADLNYQGIIETNQAQKDLSAYQYEQQKQMIAEQNEYNSPAAQMQRYREAGINPNLVYGNISAGNQSSVAQYQAPKLTPPQYAAVASQQISATVNALVNTLSNIEDYRSKKLSNVFSTKTLHDRVWKQELDAWIASNKKGTSDYDLGIKELQYYLQRILHNQDNSDFLNFSALKDSPLVKSYIKKYQYEPLLLEQSWQGKYLNNELQKLNIGFEKQMKPLNIDIKKFERDNLQTDKIITNVSKILETLIKAFGFVN